MCLAKDTTTTKKKKKMFSIFYNTIYSVNQILLSKRYNRFFCDVINFCNV